MGFKKFMANMLGLKEFMNSGFEEYSRLEARLSYKKLAFETCVSLIASAIALSEFETYEKGEKVRKENYYSLNVQPNPNQNAFEFWSGVVSKLLTDNEVLIVEVNDGWYMADTFDHDEKVFYEDIYRNVVVRDLQLHDVFRESDVLYLKYHNKDIKQLIDSMYKDYGRLIESGQKGYEHSHGKKVILELDSLVTMNEKEKEARDTLFNTHFKNFFENINSVLPLGKNMKYNEVQSKNPVKDSRDIKAMIDDVYHMTCSAFHVPVALAQGNVSGLKDIIDSFIMFSVKPIASIVQREINRKVYDKKDYLERTYMKVNTQNLKFIDIHKMANTADLYVRTGMHSINDNLEMIGKEPINEKWADLHFMTKNYSSVLDPTFNEGVKDGKQKNTTEHTK